ncbi:MAG: NRDE family protein, partial [Proteobacteria bacterium]|nr:NRDE family protein [Pseudomonadota bacterium]
MCLILFGYKVKKKYPLILIANRDEFFHRPTAPLHFWENNAGLLAGKDLEQGGTWLGVHKNGKFCALTNYRDPFLIKQNAPSRGEILVDYLESQIPCDAYFNVLKKNAAAYNGFNLLFGDKNGIYWFSNLKNRVERIQPGIHGLSNRFLDT